jgi:hypothetical protein
MAEVLRRTGHQARVEAADWKDTLGRVGLVGRGVLYAIIGGATTITLSGVTQSVQTQGGFVSLGVSTGGNTAGNTQVSTGSRFV